MSLDHLNHTNTIVPKIDSPFIGRGEKLVERIISILFEHSEVLRQVSISKLVNYEDFREYGKEFSKHKCDLVVEIVDSTGTVKILVIEVNYRHGEKAAKKWRQTFAPDIKRAGNIPITIDAYDCRSLFKCNDKKDQKITWDNVRDVIDQLEKAGVLFEKYISIPAQNSRLEL